MMKNVAIFCGSSRGNDPAYVQATMDVATILSQHNVAIVYGGATVGLMGVLADTMLSCGGEVTGVIPTSMVAVEIAHQELTQLHVVKTMHERKALIADIADGFMLLPGGAGSLDEFFEIFTWLQLGYHHKPCAILNINGYFDALLDFIAHTVKQGFMKASNQQAMIVETDAQAIVSRLLQQGAVRLEKKWIKS